MRADEVINHTNELPRIGKARILPSGWVKWLLLQVDYEKRYAYGLHIHQVMDALSNISFEPMIQEDVGEVQNVLTMRGYWLEDQGLLDDSAKVYGYFGDVTILEILACLAMRMEEIMLDASYGDRTGQWFFTMLHNLGLLDERFRDENLKGKKNTYILHIVYEQVRGFLTRDTVGTYPFNLPNREEERHMSLWMQANAYLNYL